MSREWEPGEVALVDSWRGKGLLAFRVQRGGFTRWCVLDGTDSRGLDDHEVTATRPALVIDPEDRADIEQIANAFCEVPSSGWSDQMQAALRSLFAPPRPPEPERLAALVEDASGAKYVSVADPIDGWMAGKRWQRIGGEINTVRNFGWSDLDVVRVLSDGWVAES